MPAGNSDFVDALVSDGAHPAIPANDRIFAPFIGSWSLDVTWFDAEGRVSRQERGEWHFAWVLEGRAIQDVWIVPPRSARAGRADDLYEYGASLRFYDPQTGAWQSTWFGPMHRVVRIFTARRVEGKVVLETTAGHTPRMRWSFGSIRPDSFDWTNEVADDGTWRVQQTFKAQRA